MFLEHSGLLAAHICRAITGSQPHRPPREQQGLFRGNGRDGGGCLKRRSREFGSFGAPDPIPRSVPSCAVHRRRKKDWGIIRSSKAAADNPTPMICGPYFPGLPSVNLFNTNPAKAISCLLAFPPHRPAAVERELLCRSILESRSIAAGSGFGGNPAPRR